MAANGGKYFDLNGVRYYTGTIFECYNFLSSSPNENIIQVEFLQCFNNNGEKCLIKEKTQGWQHICDINDFKNNIIRAIENPGRAVLDTENQKYANNKECYHWVEDGEDFYSYKDASYYNGVVWYIIIMLFLTITNGRIAGWIVTTIIFLIWRNKKLKGK